MLPSVEKQFASIVLLGKFNPAIFSPAWLAKYGLITDGEMDAATVNIVHQEITQFVAGGYSFDINQPRFLVRSSDEPFVKLLELVAGIFGEHLVHTPILKVGINFEAIYAARSAKQRMAFGRLLAPVDPWGEFGKRMEHQSPLKGGGIVSLTMQENPPDRKGYRRVEIEPVPDASATRAKIAVNDHFETKDEDKVVGAGEIMSILQSSFEPSMLESRRIIDELIDTCLGLPE